MGLPENCAWKPEARYPKGTHNRITDVPGVRVGQVTLLDDARDVRTGVTAILPHGGNLFREKVMAGCCVINGFGKSAGLLQVEELGTIESPIVMTNTLSVGTALTASVRYMLARCPEIGVTTGTVNCIVTECNDGSLNDIRGLHVREEDVLEAICSAGEDFAEGSAGAGTGMICMGLKGGIGSASRVLEYDGKSYVLGALVLANFGSAGHLRIGGRRAVLPGGEKTASEKLPSQISPGEASAYTKKSEEKIPEAKDDSAGEADKGSVIIVIATDLPLSDRQLKRTARRAVIGLGRVGSYIGNGSGDIAVAFSTGNMVPHESESAVLAMRMLRDSALDRVFEATAEAVEEAVLSSLWHAAPMTGIRGRCVRSLRECSVE